MALDEWHSSVQESVSDQPILGDSLVPSDLWGGIREIYRDLAQQ